MNDDLNDWSLTGGKDRSCWFLSVYGLNTCLGGGKMDLRYGGTCPLTILYSTTSFAYSLLAWRVGQFSSLRRRVNIIHINTN